MEKDIYEEIFLNKGLAFIGVDDLYRNIKQVRIGYLSLEKGVQNVYKWYFFYQLCIAKDVGLKSAMWTFINCSDEASDNNYAQVVEKYTLFDERRNNLFKSKN